jgi:hypothetical protein
MRPPALFSRLDKTRLRGFPMRCGDASRHAAHLQTDAVCAIVMNYQAPFTGATTRSNQDVTVG